MFSSCASRGNKMHSVCSWHLKQVVRVAEATAGLLVLVQPPPSWPGLPLHGASLGLLTAAGIGVEGCPVALKGFLFSYVFCSC